jgi:hypothetical protein
MNRRDLVGGLTPASGGLLLNASSSAAAKFSSQGYGLYVDDFTALNGPGEPGQSYLQYPQADGMMFVGQDSDSTVVNFIERYWNPETRGTKSGAATEVAALLPVDSELNESYEAQFGYIGYGTMIERYRSGTLKTQFGPDATSSNAIFVVVYEYVPSTTSMEQLVLRFSILAATGIET